LGIAQGGWLGGASWCTCCGGSLRDISGGGLVSGNGDRGRRMSAMGGERLCVHVYPLKVNTKESHRFRRYNHHNLHKQGPNKVKNNHHFVNLSSCALIKEISILSKSLGFVPSPTVPHPSTIHVKYINEFAHKLRLKYEFHQNRPTKRRFKP